MTALWLPANQLLASSSPPSVSLGRRVEAECVTWCAESITVYFSLSSWVAKRRDACQSRWDIFSAAAAEGWQKINSKKKKAECKGQTLNSLYQIKASTVNFTFFPPKAVKHWRRHRRAKHEAPNKQYISVTSALSKPKIYTLSCLFQAECSFENAVILGVIFQLWAAFQLPLCSKMRLICWNGDTTIMSSQVRLLRTSFFRTCMGFWNHVRFFLLKSKAWIKATQHLLLCSWRHFWRKVNRFQAQRNLSKSTPAYFLFQLQSCLPTIRSTNQLVWHSFIRFTLELQNDSWSCVQFDLNMQLSI